MIALKELYRSSPMAASETLSVSQAAKRAAVSPSTIRRWIDSGAIKHSTSSEGWRLITAQDLMGYLSQHGPETPRIVRGASAREAPVVSTGATGEALKIALEALDRERKINDELRAQVRSLEQERTQHIAEMRALLSGKSEGLLSIKKWFGKTL
jgi:excisionase family DNA binding protein